MNNNVRIQRCLLLTAIFLLVGLNTSYGESLDTMPFVEGSATVVVLPDTQYYSQKYPHYFEAQTKWIADNYKKRNIVYVLHQGDIVQHDAPREWEVTVRCFDMIDGKVPYALAPGNHDYHGPRETRINEYFPLSKQKKYTGIAGVFEKDRVENCYHLATIGGQEWIILALEYGPRDKVLAWANEVLAQYPDRKAILVTHGYLYYNNQRFDYRRGKQRANPHGAFGDGNDGEEMWEKLVRKHKNMMLVVCGHLASAYVGYRADEGDYGNIVHQMLIDYQKMRRGGQAYMRLLEFHPDGKTVQVRTFSPATKMIRSPITRGENPLRDPKLEEFTFELKGPTRDKPKPVASVPGKPLSKTPIRRWSFNNTDTDATVMRESIAGDHAVRSGEAELNGRGQVVLNKKGHVALPPGLLDGLQDATFEVWFAPTSDSYSWDNAVRFGNGGDYLLYCFRTPTLHRAGICNAGHNERFQLPAPFKKGKPMQVVVTYDHDGADGHPQLSYYRDGENFGRMRTSIKLSDVSTPHSRLGPFAGEFDELRLYDRALSPAEVAGNYNTGPDQLNLAEGVQLPQATEASAEPSVPRWARSDLPLRRAPIHRYSFDGEGGDGTVLIDSVGDENGTLHAPNDAARLNGQGQLLIDANDGKASGKLDASLLKGREEVSFEVWFTPTAKSYNWDPVVKFAGDGDDFYYLFRSLHTHRAELIVGGHNERIQRKGVPVTPGQLMQVVVTYDQDGHDSRPLLCSYVNGKLIGRIGTSIKLSELELTSGQVGPFAGKFDDLRIYDYPLNAKEVASNFEAGPDKLEVAEANAR